MAIGAPAVGSEVYHVTDGSQVDAYLINSTANDILLDPLALVTNVEIIPTSIFVQGLFQEQIRVVNNEDLTDQGISLNNIYTGITFNNQQNKITFLDPIELDRIIMADRYAGWNDSVPKLVMGVGEDESEIIAGATEDTVVFKILDTTPLSVARILYTYSSSGMSPNIRPNLENVVVFSEATFESEVHESNTEQPSDPVTVVPGSTPQSNASEGTSGEVPGDSTLDSSTKRRKKNKLRRTPPGPSADQVYDNQEGPYIDKITFTYPNDLTKMCIADRPADFGQYGGLLLTDDINSVLNYDHSVENRNLDDVVYVVTDEVDPPSGRRFLLVENNGVFSYTELEPLHFLVITSMSEFIETVVEDIPTVPPPEMFYDESWVDAPVVQRANNGELRFKKRLTMPIDPKDHSIFFVFNPETNLYNIWYKHPGFSLLEVTASDMVNLINNAYLLNKAVFMHHLVDDMGFPTGSYKNNTKINRYTVSVNDPYTEFSYNYL